MIRANENTPPARLVEYLDRDLEKTDLVLRRRSVLTRSQQGEWILVISVAQAFPDRASCPSPELPRRYDTLLLLEDWLDGRQARSFVDEVQTGTITLGGQTLSRSSSAIWQTEFVSPPNSFMDRVGLVIQTRFDTGQIVLAQEPLISVAEPYYPDATSALQDWAGLIQHHGHGDSRNGQIVFLLPEARAFFTEVISDNGVLRLTLAGSDVGSVGLVVKGAYWMSGRIHHFESGVSSDHVELRVPNEVERLEYVLIGPDGQMYDLQREAWGTTAGLTRQRSEQPDDALMAQVGDAREAGEGEEIEFKPFVDPAQPIGPVRGKSKFREIVRTIAAFANTRGGCIYLGVDDDCSLRGIQDDLAKWAKAKIGEDVLARYKGALTNKIRGELVGDVRFWIAFAAIDRATVAVISVSPFEAAPVGLKDEGLCYVRRGSSDRYLSPHEWLTVFGEPIDQWQ